jgi:hypothetical protein
MSFPYTPNLKDAKIESLKTQYEFLNLLRLRHLQWMSSADDAEVEGRHSEIVELIEAVTDQYRELLHTLPATGNGHEGERIL